MTYKKYVAKYEYHQPRLAEIEVERETDKTIIRTGKIIEIIRGFYYLPERILKDNYNTFDTQEDALNWLITQVYKDIAGMQILIDKANANIQILSKMKREKA